MSDSPDDIARRIAELETTLKLPLPEAALAPLRAELARLRALLTGDTSESISTYISGEANVAAAVGRDVHGSINHGPVLPPGASGVTVATTLNQFYGTHEGESRATPSPAYSASDVSQLRQQALLAAFRKDWIAAADLLARLVERDPHDAAAVTQLDHARGQLRLHDRYAVARVLRQAGEWQAVLGALAEIDAAHPGYPDLDQLRVWAESERQRAVWEPRFGPVFAEVAEGRFADALRMLRRHLAQNGANEAAVRAAAYLLQDSSLDAPARVRVAYGELLAQHGDPRPGVCELPPAMVEIQGGRFQIGLIEAEHRTIIEQERANGLADQAKSWYQRCVNQQAVSVASFELARYPLTNAQYKLFMDAGGYDPAAPWWELSADWLRSAGVVAPEYWAHDRFGVLRPNHPVVGISWYEAMAFCAWLTEHLDDGYVYRLPSEAEWEYAARGAARRTYPWGKEALDGERANYGGVNDGTTAVGCFPLGATPETGLMDMSGNVWEWTRSEYKPYPYIATDGREESANLSGKTFTLRGGSWGYRPILLRAAFRDDDAPDYRDYYIGVRLARHRKM